MKRNLISALISESTSPIFKIISVLNSVDHHASKHHHATTQRSEVLIKNDKKREKITPFESLHCIRCLNG